MNRSQGDPEERFKINLTEVEDINATLEGKEVIVRGRLHNSRGAGAMVFVVMRHQFYTVQAILRVGEDNGVNVSKGMINFAKKVPKESIIEIKAKVTLPAEAI